MTPLKRWLPPLGVVWLCLARVFATEAESNVFEVDARDPGGTTESESAVFAIGGRYLGDSTGNPDIIAFGMEGMEPFTDPNPPVGKAFYRVEGE